MRYALFFLVALCAFGQPGGRGISGSGPVVLPQCTATKTTNCTPQVSGAGAIVPTSATAGTATAVAGGVAGQYLYQSAAGVTGFKTPNAANGPAQLDSSGNLLIGTTVHSPATSEPVCGILTRGFVVSVQGGAGVSDTYRRCEKTAADTYEWRALSSVLPAVFTDSGTALTLTGRHLLFSLDNTWDIGANGATRPRHYYGAGNGVFGGTVSAQSGGTVAGWQTVAINYTAGVFTTAAASVTSTVAAIPARGAIEGVCIKTTTAFAGTGITSMTVSLGDGTTADVYAPAFDLMAAVTNTNQWCDGGAYVPTAAAHNVVATFTANVAVGDGANTVLTQGEVQIDYKYAGRP